MEQECNSPVADAWPPACFSYLLVAMHKHKIIALCSNSCCFNCPNACESRRYLLPAALGSKMDVGAYRVKVRWSVGLKTIFLDFNTKVGGLNLTRDELLTVRAMYKHRKM